MKMTIDAGMMKEMFKSWDRDYYTHEACEALEQWYDDIDPNFEFNVIDICCEWSEYGETPCLTWRDFLIDNKHILDDIDGAEEMTEDEKINAIIDELEDRTSVIRLSNSVLVGEY